MKYFVVALLVGASLAFPLYLFLRLMNSSRSYELSYYDTWAVVMIYLFPAAHVFWSAWAAEKRDQHIAQLEKDNEILNRWNYGT